MTYGILRKIAPLALLGVAGLYAHGPEARGYYEGYDYGLHHHQRDEKRDLREHQREERWYYGDSWALRQHQREEQRELKHHQRDERGYDNNGYYGNGYYGRDGYSNRGWYDGRR